MKKVNRELLARAELLIKRNELSNNLKYHRGVRYEHKVRPNWSAMPKSIQANTSKRTSMLINWCDKHCTGNYSYDGVTVGFSFVESKDAMLFKLTWG